VAHTELALDELAKYHAVTHAFIMAKAKSSSLQQTLKAIIAFFFEKLKHFDNCLLHQVLAFKSY
jgi:hypothetical protein